MIFLALGVGIVLAALLRRAQDRLTPRARASTEAWWAQAGRTDSLAAWTQRWTLTGFALALASLSLHPAILILPPLPWLRLRAQARARQARLLKDFPSELESIAVMIETGHDVILSLQRLREEDATPPLRAEWGAMLSALRLGQARAEVFRAFAERNPDPAFFEFAMNVAQSDASGMGLSGLLRHQAAAVRARIFRQAELRAQKAPFMMLIPLLGLIFPVTILMLLAPLALSFQW